MPLERAGDRLILSDNPFPLERRLGIALLGFAGAAELALALATWRAPETFSAAATLVFGLSVPLFLVVIWFALRGRATTRITLERGRAEMAVEQVAMFDTSEQILPVEAMREITLREVTRGAVETLYAVVVNVDGVGELTVAIDPNRSAMEAERRRIAWFLGTEIPGKE